MARLVRSAPCAGTSVYTLDCPLPHLCAGPAVTSQSRGKERGQHTTCNYCSRLSRSCWGLTGAPRVYPSPRSLSAAQYHGPKAGRLAGPGRPRCRSVRRTIEYTIRGAAAGLSSVVRRRLLRLLRCASVQVCPAPSLCGQTPQAGPRTQAESRQRAQDAEAEPGPRHRWIKRVPLRERGVRQAAVDAPTGARPVRGRLGWCVSAAGRSCRTARWPSWLYLWPTCDGAPHSACTAALAFSRAASR